MRDDRGWPDDIRSIYPLGPDDQISINALDAEEISRKPFTIGSNGYLNLPMIGRLHAAGLTIDELEAVLVEQLKKYIRSPQVSVSISELRSQPVSVIGAVYSPGVHQLRGRKNLIDMLSLAGGLRPEAGYIIKITRQARWSRIRLSSSSISPDGDFSVAEVKVKELLEAGDPQQNIAIMPNDVIAVPPGELVYVVGEVRKSGGFRLGERKTMSVLEALSLAEGLDKAAAPQHAKILRKSGSNTERMQIAVDVRKILAGKADDLPLQGNDILFVPSSASRKAAVRALETAIQTGSGIVIWHGARY